MFNAHKCLSVSNYISLECEHKPNLKVKHLLVTFIDEFSQSESFHQKESTNLIMFILQATIFPLPQRWLVSVVIKNSFLIHSGAVSKNLNECF